MVVFLKSGKASEVNSDNPEFAKYISAYTSGMISKKSTVKIRLVGEVAEKIKNTGLSDELIEFEPSVDGTVAWADETTLEFTPDEDLKSGQKYIAMFHLGEVVEVEEDISDFNFEFEVIKQNFEVTIDEQKTIDRKKLRWQKAIGTVLTADVEDSDKLQNILIATQNGKKLDIKWTVTEDQKKYHFEIDSIARGEKASEVVLSWDGASIDVDKQGKTRIEIPSIFDFKYMSSKVVQSPEQFLQIQFSDPLNENQLLDGLVRIDEISGLRFVVEDNLIKVYPSYHLDGNYQVYVEEGITNILGTKLKRGVSFPAIFEQIMPGVRFVGEGVILPGSEEGLIVPFEAVSLTAVDVQIIRIYENNIMQFLQVNDLEGDYELTRVGKPVLRKTIQLDNQGVVDLGKWNRFYLDMNKLISAEPGAIYRITIGFRKKHAVYGCSEEEGETGEEGQVIETEFQGEEEGMTSTFGAFEIEDFESSYWDGFEDYYYGYYYNWEDRDDPCKDAYYGGRRNVSKNIIASNIGIIAKRGNDQSMNVFITDIRTTQPKEGVTVEIYDYTQQLLGTSKTDKEGHASFTKIEEPYFLIAKEGTQKGYLKLYDGASLSLSRFDIAGASIEKGTKGFIYGERGVWRPGDSLYITFILEESDMNVVPDKHPVVFELRNPQNQLIKRLVQPKNKTGFYSFRFKTDIDAPTGIWSALVSIGGLKFQQNLQIETIKPNRLKILIDFGKDDLKKNTTAWGNMEVKWLHGAVAKSLDAKVDVVMNAVPTYFEKYKDYTFDDATKNFYSESTTVFDEKIDETGHAKIKAEFSTGESSPGKLKATFITKVFEKGGDFSTDQFSLIYHPYESYVGIKAPKGDKARGMLLTDTTHTINLVIVDDKGKLVTASHDIKMEFYKVDWRWWYDQNDEYSSYSSSDYMDELATEKITSRNGKASWKIRVNYPDWGRYMIRAYDEVSGHSTSMYLYIDWPGWAGRAQREGSEGATMLMFTSDREKYNVGETVNLNIPTSEGGRALVSIESGSKVIKSFWVEAQKGNTQYSFMATKDMAPNVYVNVTLLQPHSQTANDLPIRMYGVIPVTIEDPTTHLNPVLEMPDVLQSESTVKVRVKEKSGKPMTYTIAMVDEGLLDLTRFATPDPWNHFYAKEALGVKTWDIYDWVIGAYGGNIERLLSIGGDGELGDGKGGNKSANRFKPMVRFYGPYELGTLQTKTHNIKIPKYIGSVRTMVICGKDKAYGQVEKTTPVRKPLMILGTLPRVLGPKETVKLPVTVFAMEKNVKNVTVQLKTDKYLKVVGPSKKTLTFSQPGESFVEFDIEVQPIIGVSKVEILAWSETEKASYDMELNIRNPNPKVTDVVSEIVEPGKSWTTTYKPVGISGTNSGTLEVSSLPPFNLAKRMKYLIQYPHGCVEQTTSSVFPQLFLADMIELTKQKKSDIDRNVKAGIKRLQGFQIFNGGLSYWPGGTDADEWGTSYAGHFMLEAQAKGYTIPSGFLKKWKAYQQKKAKNWTDDGPHSQFIQAYRLYTLALSGEAEMGAMNRLREKSTLSEEAKWRLAAAYLIASKKSIAEKLIYGLSTKVKEYNELAYTYGSGTRDKAMILETLTLLGKKKDAYTLLKEISNDLGSESWYSTQTTAYSLVAASKYIKKNTSGQNLTYSYKLNNGQLESISSHNLISQVEIPVKTTDDGTLVFNNTTQGVLFVRIILEGIPEAGDETESENDLRMSIVYKSTDGTVIDPTKLDQGTDFMAEVTITHPGFRNEYKQMALTQIFPSGWEIINTRMLDYNSYSTTSVPTYQNVRDDRVYTYFDINRSNSKTFRIMLNASYAGKFYLPAATCEAMYDNTINSRKKGRWVEVVRPE